MESAQNNPVGRPSTYDPAYCEQVIGWGREGKSRTWIAATIGVTRQTLGNWEQAHPEFLHAMALAKGLEQLWWEDAGQSGMLMQGFGSSVWSRSMAARFPDEWRENSRQEVTGANGGAIQHEVRRTIYDPKAD